MSLLDDTIRDARRPLVLRHSASESASAAADETLAASRDDAPWPATRAAGEARDGHPANQARDDRDDFRREGQSMPREASYPSGSGISRLPAGDPLSAAMDAERPKSSAKNVGLSDVTVMGDSRTSELATGPENGGSPGKVAAAAAGSASMALQSAVLPGSSEAEWSRARSLSMTPEGSTTTVSADGETFLSRPPGRGAPSENLHPTSAGTPARPAATSRGDRAAPPGGASTGAAGAAESADSADSADSANSTGCDDAATALQARHAVHALHALHARQATGTARAGGTPGPALPARPDPPRQCVAMGARTADARYAGQVVDLSGVQLRPAQAASDDAAPTLSIGRIDVTVVTDAVPALSTDSASVPEASGEAGVTGFLACNYLKRL
jgi:hypothetical protein